MDHRIDMRRAFPLTPLFPGLNLTYALYLLQLYGTLAIWALLTSLKNQYKNYYKESALDLMLKNIHFKRHYSIDI